MDTGEMESGIDTDVRRHQGEMIVTEAIKGGLTLGSEGDKIAIHMLEHV